MINKCCFIGNVGSDPEIRQAGDAKVANFKIACSENWKDKAGEKQTSTEWIPIVAWRQLADITEKYVTKGQQVYVEGKMKTRTYEKDGVKHYATEVHIDTLKMLGQKKTEDAASQPATKPSSGLQTNVHPNLEGYTPAPEGVDDLPF
ncbi:MAG: single-stranded DNA-binding protein [Bacteroidia bacterium]|nr:single-stranded DNA-binding protein [Bacteroidia bacterium]